MTRNELTKLWNKITSIFARKTDLTTKADVNGNITENFNVSSLKINTTTINSGTPTISFKHDSFNTPVYLNLANGGSIALTDDIKNPLLVTLTWDDNLSRYTADKTYSEISSAYDNGQNIIVTDEQNIYTLYAIDNDNFYFGSFYFDEPEGRYIAILNNNGNWSESFYYSQPLLVSGTNIKTINNNSLLGSGDLSLDSSHFLYDGNGGNYINLGDTIEEALEGLDTGISNLTPNEISSVTATPTASGNTVTITETNGTTTTFNVQNGADGVSLGEIGLVQTTGDATDKVMSQKAVSDYARKVTQSDLNGTSDWIKSKLTELGWEFDKYVNINGLIINYTGLCITPFITIGDLAGHSITYNYMHNYTSSCVVFYNASGTRVNGWNLSGVNTRTVTPTAAQISGATLIKITFNLNDLTNCFIKDNTTGEYIFKGDEYLADLCKDKVLTPNVLESAYITQETGDNTKTTMSLKAITDADLNTAIRQVKYSNFAVAGDNHNAVSTDTFSMSELKHLSSFLVYGLWDSNTRNRYNLGYYLGITKDSSPDVNFFGIYVYGGYYVKLLLKVNGTEILNQLLFAFTAGTGNFPLSDKNYTTINFYTKKINMYGAYLNGNNIVNIIDSYDFADLDLSAFTDVQIVTSLGHSNNSYELFNEIGINAFFTDYNTLFARKINYGEYNSTVEYSVGKRNPETPSTFYIGDVSDNVTLTVDEPLHKKFSFSAETRLLVKKFGMTTSDASYIRCYILYKAKFTNITGNIYMSGWYGNDSYMIDSSENITAIKCSATNTNPVETLLPVEEGEEYIFLKPFENGNYDVTYNTYFTGDFTMEIYDPVIISWGRVNLCSERYNGTHYIGYYPFKATTAPVIKGLYEFNTATGTNIYGELIGRIRINPTNGKIYMSNGTDWKQISN